MNIKVKNKSGKIIGIGAISLLPDAVAQLPTGYEENPVIKFFAETGRVELIEESDNATVSNNTSYQG